MELEFEKQVGFDCSLGHNSQARIHFSSLGVLIFLSVTITVTGRMKKVFIRVAFEKKDTVLVFLVFQSKSKYITSFTKIIKNAAVAGKLQNMMLKILPSF